MTDVVLIPTYYRPEYLSLCLEKLAAADGAKEKEVWVAHDIHDGDERRLSRTTFELRRDLDDTPKVVKQWENCFASIRYIQRQPHRYLGNPFNFLELYKEAYRDSRFRYVFLVEDDVHVAPDFFRWHEAVQARGDYFVTVGWHCIRNPEARTAGGPEEYIESTRDFSSIGVCWRRDNLKSIAMHAQPTYYQSMGVYMGRTFPGSPIPAGQWTEQAGLIMRTLLAAKDKLTVAWPVLRRCSHVGVNGYHRQAGFRFGGSVEQRIEGLRAACTRGTINTLSKDPFDDIDSPIEVSNWTPESLRVVQKFKWEGKL